MHSFIIENNSQCDGDCFCSETFQSLVRLREHVFCLKFPDVCVVKIYAFLIENLANNNVTCYSQITQSALF